MAECFKCKKNIGMMATRWTLSMLSSDGVTPPAGFTKDDKLCNDCKKELKQASKAEKEEVKEMMQEELGEILKKVPEYKMKWNKNGIIQFKNERIAILKRAVGAQVEFIVAFDEITQEGYRLMAIDEGMQAQGAGLTGGVNAFFYFQKMEYVR